MNSFILILALTMCFNMSNVLGGCPRRSTFDRSSNNNALTAANNFMLDRYVKTKADVLSLTKDYPLVILQDDILTLYIDGKEIQQVSLDLVLYDNLKMVAHVPFTAMLLTEPSVHLAKDREALYPIDEIELGQIRTYLHIIENVMAELPTCCNFTGAILQRQIGIVTTAKMFLLNALDQKSVSKASIAKMANLTISSIDINTKEAVIARIDKLHSIMLSWKAQLSPIQWDHLHVIIMGAHMPRNRSLELQYFSRLLQTPPDSGLRVIFGENITTMEEALDLLATHLVDFEAGEAFWGRKEAMHSDVQAKATEEYLPKIFPNEDM